MGKCDQDYYDCQSHSCNSIKMEFHRFENLYERIYHILFSLTLYHLHQTKINHVSEERKQGSQRKRIANKNTGRLGGASVDWARDERPNHLEGICEQ